MAKKVICYGQTNTGVWCQEVYDTGSMHARHRAAQLRQAGYTVKVSAMGAQITRVGYVKMTLVDIRPGRHGDTCSLPDVHTEKI